MLPKILSLVSIVLSIGWMLYLLLATIPLLTLKLDDASDTRLVRGMFDVHYRVLMTITAIGAVSSFLVDRRLLGAAFAFIALVGFTARYLIVGRMDGLRATMTAADTPAITTFRRLHVSGLVLDVALIFGFFAVLGTMSASMITCTEIPPGCQGDACRVQCSLLI